MQKLWNYLLCLSIIIVWGLGLGSVYTHTHGMSRVSETHQVLGMSQVCLPSPLPL